VKVILHTILGLKQVLGQRQTEVDLPEGSTIGDLLAYMKTTWGDKLSPHLFEPESGRLLPQIRVMVNGQTIQFLQGLETLLKEADEVLILPLVAGGQSSMREVASPP
jgi:molybdopterin synthase sulfur carrier subunit